MRLRPFFSYYGGKWRDTPRLYPEPRYSTVVEPFAGSAGYSLRYPQNQVVLYEIDPIVVEVWRYLINAPEQEILSIPDVPMSGGLESLGLIQEQEWLVGFWLNRGVASPRKTPSRWMRDGIRPGSFWGERVRTTIAAQQKYIRHWTIIEKSYRECPIDLEATWFVDPPYQHAGQYYRFGSGQIDYHDLGAWVHSLKGQVMVCENDTATWLPFVSVGRTKTTRNGKRSAEAYWTNDMQKS